MCAGTKTQVSNNVVSTSGSIINKTQKETLETLAGIFGGVDLLRQQVGYYGIVYILTIVTKLCIL